MERQLALLADAIEKASNENRCTTVETMAEAVVKDYLKAYMTQAKVSPALYLVTKELDARPLIEQATRRSERAIETMLVSASDGRLFDPHVIAQTMAAALYGTVPAFCPRVLSAAHSREAEKQLTIMFRSYLVAQQSNTKDIE
jgi:hypothetical protein